MPRALRRISRNSPILLPATPSRFAQVIEAVQRFDRRRVAALIAEEPGLYAVTPHYETYSGVLVRLPKIRRDELR